jgi:hypothetical protein
MFLQWHLSHLLRTASPVASPVASQLGSKQDAMPQDEHCPRTLWLNKSKGKVHKFIEACMFPKING